jgi:O-antigen ligase
MSAPALLIVAMLFSTATQMRAGEIPVGPGEIFLAAWIGYAGLRPLVERRWGGQAPQFRPLFLFWGAAGLLLLAGTASGWRSGLLSYDKALHDAAAYVLISVFSLILAKQGQLANPQHLSRQVVSAMALCGLVLLGLAALAPRIGSVIFWYGDRFSGWSENPNQFAQIMIPVPFLAAFTAARSPSATDRLYFYVVFAVTVVVGLLVRSDALLVAWLVALAVSVFLLVRNAMAAPRASPASAMFVRVTVPVAMVLLAGVAFMLGFEQLRSAVMGVVTEGGQGAIRLILWFNGIRALLASPVVGLGPGAHSGLLGPFEDKEAHNSMIDWATSTGLIGLLALAILAWALFRPVWRSRSAALVGSFTALLVFAQIHFALRQPLFWFWMILIAGLGHGLVARQERGTSAATAVMSRQAAGAT